MRIDVFFDVYPHPAKPYFESQLTEWRRQGHQLRLFSFGNIPGASSEFPITAIRTLRQRPLHVGFAALRRCVTDPARSWRTFRSQHGLLAAIKALATDAQLPGEQPDVNFIHNLATAVALAHLKRACPDATLAIYYHGGEIPGVRQIPFDQSSRALGQADVVFSNTRASVSEAVSRGAPPQRTAAIPVGFPLERFRLPDSRAYLAGDRWRFMCLGRLAPEKGFDIALNAFAALHRRNAAFEVTLIGDGPEMAKLKQLAADLRLQDVARFAGHVDFAKLIAMFAEFDALVLSSVPVDGSSWTETQATVMQEAMLMGAIVIASDMGGVRESLPPALHPYLYAPGSTQELTARLASVISLRGSELRALGDTARAFAAANYDIRTINQRLLAAIRPPGRGRC